MKTEYTCARKVNEIPCDVPGGTSVIVLQYYSENARGCAVYRETARFLGRSNAEDYAKWLSAKNQERVKVVDVWGIQPAEIVAVFENGEEVSPLLFWS